jgi:peroxiredoxin Q/BCP
MLYPLSYEGVVICESLFSHNIRLILGLKNYLIITHSKNLTIMLTKIIFYSAILLIAFFGYRILSAAPNTPKIGTRAPDFNLPDATGVIVSLTHLQGSWVVLYFYPKDDTPGCTKEACSFRDDMHKLEKLNAKVIGVSVDDGKSHADFAKKYSLPFPLLTDTDGLVANKYGALTNLGVTKIAKRYTFLIDPDGVLRKTYLSVDTSKHSQQIIDDLIALTETKTS